MDTHAARLTVLLDDIVNDMGLKAEHGLSFLLEKDDQAILLDTGQTGLFLENARTLGKDLSRVKAVVLSHGHYDHTGGLLEALKVARNATVYAHPSVFVKRYAIKKNGQAVSAGIRVSREQVEALRPLVLSKEPMEIAAGIRTTGEVPRVTDFEDTGGPFFLDTLGKEKDELPDDLAIFFESDKGAVVLLGCAHAGVVNTLERVAELTGRRQIYAVVGGTHLVTASEKRLQRTCEAYRRFDVKKIGMAHCVGLPAIVRFMSEFPRECFLCPTGLTFSL